MTVNQRIKQVRKTLSLSQITFSKGIYLSHGYLAEIELEHSKANDRIIELVVSKYGVSRRWLETGEGEMFDKRPDEKLEEMMIVFRDLVPQYRELVLTIIGQLLKIQKKPGNAVKAGEPSPAKPASAGKKSKK
jgi:transcriptional regulator with XRE-family HTH domain